MTERIDLDEMDAAEEQDDEETPNRGDWFWKGEGDPDDESGAASWLSGADSAAENDTDPAAKNDTDPAAENDDGDSTDADANSGANRIPASPHVPSDTEGTPAGIPVSQGGGGAGTSSRAAGGDSADADASAGEGTTSHASGPHGGGTDDMTTAFTYRAAKRLAAPAAAFADAEQWSDWIGIVGDVDAHVIGAFQRNETIDADFFNGAGTGPAERLAGIDAHSMFYADRMVVVGVEGEESIAEEAGWEFVPIADAAEGAGWDLVPEDADASDDPDADAGR